MSIMIVEDALWSDAPILYHQLTTLWSVPLNAKYLRSSNLLYYTSHSKLESAIKRTDSRRTVWYWFKAPDEKSQVSIKGIIIRLDFCKTRFVIDDNTIIALYAITKSCIILYLVTAHAMTTITRSPISAVKTVHRYVSRPYCRYRFGVA